MSTLGDLNAIKRQDEYENDPASAMRKDAENFREGANEDLQKAEELSGQGDETAADVYRERANIQNEGADALDRDADRIEAAEQQNAQEPNDPELNQGAKEFDNAKSIGMGM